MAALFGAATLLWSGGHKGFLGSVGDNEFLTFMATHSKSYETREEYEVRAGIFRANLDYITQRNA